MEHPILQQTKYQTFRTKVRSFVDKNISPESLEWENSQTFPHYLLGEMGQAGLIGLSVPLELGGQGKDFWHDIIFAEELGRARTFGYPASVLVHTNLCLHLLARLSSRQQREEFVQPAVSGQHYLCLAITEPASGSDVSSIQTTVTPNGPMLRITGEKKYISNGSVANTVMALVRSSERDSQTSFDLVLVPRKTKGLTQVRLATNGLNTGDMGHIIFDRCEVPAENILGKPGYGFYYVTKLLQHERLVGAAYAVGIVETALADTIAFLQSRERFGGKLSQKQAIRHRMADLYAQHESAKQFTYAVAGAFARGENVDKEIIALKLNAYEVLQNILQECAQLHGAEGFVKSYWLSHMYRDSQTFTVLGGTSEIMRDILAGMLKM